jgi:hypothetical protein
MSKENIFTKLFKASPFGGGLVGASGLGGAATKKKGNRQSENVNLPQPDRVQMQLGTLRNNVENAKDTNNPSWVDLYRMYENTLGDPEVKTQRRIAVNKIKAEKFIVSKDGTDNAEMTALFQRPWFDKFKEILIDVELWGYRLCEFGQFDVDNQFIDCKLFPTYNVYPHKKHLIVEVTDTTGIPYANEDPAKGEIVNPYDYFLIELGVKDDLGLLEALTREVIIKSFARRDWNEHSEKWGQPRIVVKTDAEGKDLDVVENGARNFSRNGYAIVGTDDIVEKFEASNNGSGYLIYDKNIDKCDQYISKIINGQYGTGAEKAFVGTAEVAENILNDFHHSRLREAQNIINYELIPFLNYWGYPLEGAVGRFPSLDEKIQKAPEATEGGEEESVEDNDQKPEGNKKANARLKKKVFISPWGS